MNQFSTPNIQMSQIDQQLALDFGRFYSKPYDFVMYSFSWETGRLENYDGPDVWQELELKDAGKEIEKRAFNGKDAVMPIQMATKSGHGIGKSASVSWWILFLMSTRPFCSGSVTANTAKQLQTKTWGELAKWHKRFIANHWFVYNNSSGNMNLYHKDHKDEWRTDAYTSDEENSESFAGQHAADSTSFYIFDEASAVPEIIWEVAEGGKTDGEPWHLVFGNPTRNTGRFKEIFTNPLYDDWLKYTVDSREVKITNKEQLEKQIQIHGLNSDFVRKRILGEFPSQSELQFISENLVNDAFGRHLAERQYNFAPSIIGVDPSWTGEDDLVIVHRKGLFSEILEIVPRNDNDMAIVYKIEAYEDKLNAQAVFIDMAYGTGIYSCGKSRGREWELVHFNTKPENDDSCLNMRAYIWEQMRQWLKIGSIPPDERLKKELTSVEIVERDDGVIQLESKKNMKKRGAKSPDIADALALTFARHVRADEKNHRNQQQDIQVQNDYNPLVSNDNYDPLAS